MNVNKNPNIEKCSRRQRPTKSNKSGLSFVEREHQNERRNIILPCLESKDEPETETAAAVEKIEYWPGFTETDSEIEKYWQGLKSIDETEVEPKVEEEDSYPGLLFEDDEDTEVEPEVDEEGTNWPGLETDDDTETESEMIEEEEKNNWPGLETDDDTDTDSEMIEEEEKNNCHGLMSEIETERETEVLEYSNGNKSPECDQNRSHCGLTEGTVCSTLNSNSGVVDGDTCICVMESLDSGSVVSDDSVSNTTQVSASVFGEESNQIEFLTVEESERSEAQGFEEAESTTSQHLADNHTNVIGTEERSEQDAIDSVDSVKAFEEAENTTLAEIQTNVIATEGGSDQDAIESEESEDDDDDDETIHGDSGIFRRVLMRGFVYRPSDEAVVGARESSVTNPFNGLITRLRSRLPSESLEEYFEDDTDIDEDEDEESELYRRREVSDCEALGSIGEGRNFSTNRRTPEEVQEEKTSADIFYQDLLDVPENDLSLDHVSFLKDDVDRSSKLTQNKNKRKLEDNSFESKQKKQKSL